MSQICGKSGQTDDAYNQIDSTLKNLINEGIEIDQFTEALKYSGFNQIHAHYKDGHYHYTASNSSDGTRFSWDVDMHKNNIKGTGHLSWKDANGQWQHTKYG